MQGLPKLVVLWSHSSFAGKPTCRPDPQTELFGRFFGNLFNEANACLLVWILVCLSGNHVSLSGNRVSLGGNHVSLSGKRDSLSGDNDSLGGNRVCLSGNICGSSGNACGSRGL